MPKLALVTLMKMMPGKMLDVRHSEVAFHEQMRKELDQEELLDSSTYF